MKRMKKLAYSTVLGRFLFANATYFTLGPLVRKKKIKVASQLAKHVLRVWWLNKRQDLQNCWRLAEIATFWRNYQKNITYSAHILYFTLHLGATSHLSKLNSQEYQKS